MEKAPIEKKKHVKKNSIVVSEKHKERSEEWQRLLGLMEAKLKKKEE